MWPSVAERPDGTWDSVEDTVEIAELAPDDAGDAESVDDGIGRTGARFGPYSARRGKRGKRSSVSLASGEEPSTDEVGFVYQSGARGFGVSAPVSGAEEAQPLPWASAIVRPYAHTGGRTRSSRDLALEALVSADAWGAAASSTPQRRAIMELCAQPRSVAEIAALLSVPLGVARVLIGDLATDGAVLVHPTASVDGEAPELDLMRRVLTGLRRL
ncbi:DUF742 domain-containing protein [Actinophytocola sediminis]